MIRAKDKRNATEAYHTILEQQRKKQSEKIASVLFTRCEKAIENETTRYQTYVEMGRNWEELDDFSIADQDIIIERAIEMTEKMVTEYGYDVDIIRHRGLGTPAIIRISW